MPTTITLAGPGTVPALPPNLYPIAYAAASLPTRTWGVVLCPDNAPTLETPDGCTQVAAGKLAVVLAGSYGKLGVFVVYRCPTAVTVHTPHIEHRGNTIGTLAIDQAAAETTLVGWRHAIALQRTAERDHLVLAAVRAAHGLPAGVSDGSVLLHALRHPLPDLAYLVAYIRILGNREALHEHAITEDRRRRTHRRPRPRRTNEATGHRYQPVK